MIKVVNKNNSQMVPSYFEGFLACVSAHVRHELVGLDTRERALVALVRLLTWRRSYII